MKTSTAALAALLAAAIGTTSFVSVAAAQDAAVKIEKSDFEPGSMRMGRGGFTPWLNLVCSPKGAEELEIALVRLDHRLTLTDAQKPLYDAFRTSALTAQTGFADKCAAARPAKDAAAKPDLIDALKTRLDLDAARLEALNTVLPDFEKFYDSLTDAQKADLLPDRMERREMMRDFRGPGAGRFLRDGAPGRG
jgi:hypothetical protein